VFGSHTLTYLRHGHEGQLEDLFIAPSELSAEPWQRAIESLALADGDEK